MGWANLPISNNCADPLLNRKVNCIRIITCTEAFLCVVEVYSLKCLISVPLWLHHYHYRYYKSMPLLN